MPLLPGQPEMRLGRGASRSEYVLLPVVSVMFASLAPIFPIISEAAILPPLGFLFLVGWRLLRREIWSPWIGIPLGAFDDLFSGQPMGSAVFLWTMALLLIEMLDRRMIWRNFRQDWMIASLLSLLLLAAEKALASPGTKSWSWIFLVQLAMTILVFPAVVRVCVQLDRVRNRR